MVPVNHSEELLAFNQLYKAPALSQRDFLVHRKEFPGERSIPTGSGASELLLGSELAESGEHPLRHSR